MWSRGFLFSIYILFGSIAKSDQWQEMSIGQKLVYVSSKFYYYRNIDGICQSAFNFGVREYFPSTNAEVNLLINELRKLRVREYVWIGSYRDNPSFGDPTYHWLQEPVDPSLWFRVRGKLGQWLYLEPDHDYDTVLRTTYLSHVTRKHMLGEIGWENPALVLCVADVITTTVPTTTTTQSPKPETTEKPEATTTELKDTEEITTQGIITNGRTSTYIPMTRRPATPLKTTGKVTPHIILSTMTGKTKPSTVTTKTEMTSETMSKVITIRSSDNNTTRGMMISTLAFMNTVTSQMSTVTETLISADPTFQRTTFLHTLTDDVKVVWTTPGPKRKVHQAVPVVVCPCTCPNDTNIPMNVSAEQVQELTRQIQKNLTVDITALTATIRRKTSALDSRQSSRVAGIFGTSLLSIVFGTMFLFDFLMFLRFIYKLVKALKTTRR